MKYLAIAFTISLCLTIVSSQIGRYYGQIDGNIRAFKNYGLRQYDSDFGGFGASVYDSNFGSVRDPRQNRGPVTFPPAPADAPEESSGVIVGASGYGFVPPSAQYRSIFHTAPPPPNLNLNLDHFNNGFFSSYQYYY